MGNLASPSDAQLLMQLYDLRREPEMRKARNFVAGFWPSSADEVMAIMSKMGAPENAWLRQTTSYWEMAASFVLHGAINEDLFMENAGEMFFFYAKFQPFIGDLRAKMGAEFFTKCEALISRSPQGRDRLKGLLERFASMRGAAAKAS